MKTKTLIGGIPLKIQYAQQARAFVLARFSWLGGLSKDFQFSMLLPSGYYNIRIGDYRVDNLGI